MDQETGCNVHNQNLDSKLTDYYHDRWQNGSTPRPSQFLHSFHTRTTTSAPILQIANNNYGRQPFIHRIGEFTMKRTVTLATVLGLLLVMALALPVFAQGGPAGDGTPGVNCPNGEFVDADGDGLCDNAAQDGSWRSVRSTQWWPGGRSGAGSAWMVVGLAMWMGTAMESATTSSMRMATASVTIAANR